nr:hypothetical protein [uncultured bacterium]
MTGIDLPTVIDGADDAVAAVMAPVEQGTKYVAGAWDAVVDVWHGYFGTPIADGATNWNAYSHEQLYEMVHSGADPGQVGQQSDVLRQWAESARETTDEVDREHRETPSFWRGAASGNALGVLDQHRQGGTEATTFIASLSEAMDRASAALSEAQRTMPAPVPADAITAAGGDIGASAASAGAIGARGVGAAIDGAAGALGYQPGVENKVNSAAQGIGTFVGAGVSGLAASVASARAKAQAVAVMQRYEASLRDADAGITMPAMLPPAGPGGRSSGNGLAGLHGGSGAGALQPRADDAGLGLAGPGGSAGTSPGQATPVREWAGERGGGSGGSARLPQSGAVQSGAVPAGSSVGTSAAASSMPVGGAAAGMPLGGLPSGNVLGAGSLGASALGAGLPGAGAFGGGGANGRGPGSTSAWRDLVGNAVGPGLLPPQPAGADRTRPGSAAGHPRAGTRTAGPGLPGAPGVTRPGEEDDVEHHNKLPIDEDLFSAGDIQLPPPVIGA